MKKDQQKTKIEVIPVFGSTIRNWIRILMRNPVVSRAYFPRLVMASLLILINTPFRWYERLVIGKKICTTTIRQDPVFIIGHWRSGTTHLHNLLCQDKQFGYITYVQGFFPHSFLTNNFLKKAIIDTLPGTRPMDNMKIAFDAPQEEEIALCNMHPYSFYTGWSFPDRILHYYYRYVKFQDIPPKEMREWVSSYKRLLKAATLNMDKKRLVLKNPPNTCRIKVLLQLFPRARFIYIHRNPYRVFASTRRLYEKATPSFFLAAPLHSEKTDDIILEIYADMMKTYYRDATLIPENQLGVIRFEDLEKKPLEVLRDIYQKLNLGDFEKARPNFEAYLEGIEGYKKNVLVDNEEERQKVNKVLHFLFEKEGYPIQGEGPEQEN